MPRHPSKGPGIGGPASGLPAGGPGWGGAARGLPLQPRITPETARLLIAKRDDPEAQAAREAVAAEMLATLHNIATEGEAEAVRVNAADRVLDRILGKPKQVADITSAGERIGYVIQAPPEAESEEAWAKEHAPK